MGQKLIDIILPMYNEESSFYLLQQMFNNEMVLPADYDYEIIIVDDGSTDLTLEYSLKWQTENPRIKIVSHENNRGLGQAVLTGFWEAIKSKSDCILTMDADASHPAGTISDLVSAIALGADIAVASRFAPGGKQIGVSPIRTFYSKGARCLLSTVFPLKGVRDYTVNFRAYRTSLVQNTLSQANGPFLVFNTFTAAAEILLKLAPLAEKIVEVPLVLHYDWKESPSKLKVWATIRDYFRLCLLPKEKCMLGRGLKIRHRNVSVSTCKPTARGM